MEKTMKTQVKQTSKPKSNIHVYNQSSTRQRRRLHPLKKRPQLHGQPIQPITKQLQQHPSMINYKVRPSLNKKAPSNHKDFWGDSLHLQEAWPQHNPKGIFRFTSFNINGISSIRHYQEWQFNLQQLNSLQVDACSITEPNLDLNSTTIKDSLYQESKVYDKQIGISTSSSHEPTATKGSTFKPGGTITTVTGAWSGRIIKKGQDTFGRWSYISLRGKSNKKLTIITMYRVCAQKGANGTNTAYLQQQRELERAFNRPVDPRKKILSDMESFVNTLHSQGHIIILAGDANEDMNNPSSAINKFLSNCNLVNVMTS